MIQVSSSPFGLARSDDNMQICCVYLVLHISCVRRCVKIDMRPLLLAPPQVMRAILHLAAAAAAAVVAAAPLVVFQLHGCEVWWLAWRLGWWLVVYQLHGARVGDW